MEPSHLCSFSAESFALSAFLRIFAADLCVKSIGKFINPFTDVGFKIIFGQEFSKPRLLDFLNTLLEGERVITDLKFLDKEQPAIYDGDRSPIYDNHFERWIYILNLSDVELQGENSY